MQHDNTGCEILKLLIPCESKEIFEFIDRQLDVFYFFIKHPLSIL